MRNAPLLALCLGVLAGCSVNSASDQPPPSDSDTTTSATASRYLASDFEGDYANAVCTWYQTCASSVGTLFTSKDDCVRLFTFVAGSTFQQDNSDVDDPTLFRVDQAQAQICLQAIANTGCNQVLPTLADAACTGVINGRLNDGECCDDRGGCAAGLVCEYVENTLGNIGYCSAIGDIGETCYRQPCVEGASCVKIGDIFQCSVSLELGAGALCDDTFDCGQGLACQQAPSTGQMTCLALPDIGDFCGFDLPCRAGLFCSGDDGNVCQTTPGVVGQRCLADSDCSSGLQCAQTYDICVQLGGVGAACDESDPRYPCDPSLVCIGNLCAAIPVPVAIGDACAPDGPECPGAIGTSECVQGDTGYTCQLALKEGDPCGDPNKPECSLLSGLQCDPTSKTCVSLPKLGEHCDELCASLFVNTCAADSTCKARLPLGAPCTPLENEGDGAIFTECEILAFCVPDPTSGQNLCAKVHVGSEEICR